MLTKKRQWNWSSATRKYFSLYQTSDAYWRNAIFKAKYQPKCEIDCDQNTFHEFQSPLQVVEDKKLNETPSKNR